MRNTINGMENGFSKESLTNEPEREAKVSNENESARCSSAGAVRKVRIRELLKSNSAGAVRTPNAARDRSVSKVPNGLQCPVTETQPNNAISCEDKKRLVLHFDVRNTVLVHDSVTNINVEQSLNSFLTGVVWGEKTNSGDWKWKSHHPSLQPPSPECITYYKYMEKQLVTKPSDRALLRRTTGDFTHENIGTLLVLFSIYLLEMFINESL